MKFLTAVKVYLEAAPHGRRTSLNEMRDFREATTPEQRAAYTAELRTAGYEVED